MPTLEEQIARLADVAVRAAGSAGTEAARTDRRVQVLPIRPSRRFRAPSIAAAALVLGLLGALVWAMTSDEPAAIAPAPTTMPTETSAVPTTSPPTESIMPVTPPATTGPTVTERSVPSTIGPVHTPAVPLPWPMTGPDRLAYEQDGAVWLVGAASIPPYRVGDGTAPAWSRDGEDLAWRGANGDIAIFSTTTGGTRVVQPPAGFEYGDPVGGNDWFAAPLRSVDSGTANVIAVIPADRDAEPSVVPIPTESGTDPEIPYSIDRLTESAGSIYAVVAQDGSTAAQFDPQLWRVAADGTATRIYSECQDGPCESQLSMPSIAVSPDAQYVAYETGARNGCEVYSQPALRRLDPFEPIAISGLDGDGDSGAFRVGSIGWVDSENFLLAGRSVTIIPAAADGTPCRDEELVPSRLYSCTIDGACTATGREAELAAVGPTGNLAVADPVPADVRERWANGEPRVYDIAVEWANGERTRIQATAVPVWSP